MPAPAPAAPIVRGEVAFDLLTKPARINASNEAPTRSAIVRLPLDGSCR